MICCISPSLEHATETILTLKYAQQSLNIQNETQKRNKSLHIPQFEIDKKQFLELQKKNKELEKENEFLKHKINLKSEIEHNTEEENIEEGLNKEETDQNSHDDGVKDTKEDLINEYEQNILELNRQISKQKRQNEVYNKNINEVIENNEFMLERMSKLEELLRNVLLNQKSNFVSKVQTGHSNTERVKHNTKIGDQDDIFNNFEYLKWKQVLQEENTNLMGK